MPNSSPISVLEVVPIMTNDQTGLDSQQNSNQAQHLQLLKEITQRKTSTYYSFLDRFSHFLVKQRILLGILSLLFLVITTALSILSCEVPDIDDPFADFVTIQTDWSAKTEQFNSFMSETLTKPGEYNYLNFKWSSTRKLNRAKRSISDSYEHDSRFLTDSTQLCFDLYGYSDPSHVNLWSTYENQARLIVSMDKQPQILNHSDASNQLPLDNFFNHLHAFSSLCDLQQRIFLLETYQKFCHLKRTSIQQSNIAKISKLCCPFWSVPNLVAMIMSKQSCQQLNNSEIQAAGQLLNSCLPAFKSGQLRRSCWDKHGTDPSLICPLVQPAECLSSDLIPLVLATLLPDNTNHPSNWRTTLLQIPIRRQDSVTFYEELYKTYKSGAITRDLPVPLYLQGMHFHAYEATVNKLINYDTIWIVISFLSLVGLLALWTRTLIIPFLTLTTIFWSLLVAYAVYTKLLWIPQFPIINLMAVVLVIGLGSDDLLIFYQVWEHSATLFTNGHATNFSLCSGTCHRKKKKKLDKLTDINHHLSPLNLSLQNSLYATNPSSQTTSSKSRKCCTCYHGNTNSDNLIILSKRLHFTLRRAIPTMALTTLSTLSGLLINLSSSIVAVQRFAVFTSLVVVLNFLFVILLIPILLVILKCPFKLLNLFSCFDHHLDCNPKPGLYTHLFAKFVINLRFLFPFILILIITLSVYELLIEHRFDAPKGKLVSSSLLQPNHPFELFFDQSAWFWAERNLHHHNNILTVNFVWGPIPNDQRSLLTYKHDSVTHQPLILDPLFDLTNSSARIWLSEFCEHLKRMPWLFRHTYSHLGHDTLTSFKISILNPTLDAPVWCPIGRFTNSLDNYVLAHSCSAQSRVCCPNGEPLDIRNSAPTLFRLCVAEYLSQNLQRFPRHYGSGFRFLTANSSEPVGLIITAYTNISMISTSHKNIKLCLDQISDWFKSLLKNAPNSLQKGFLATPNAINYEVVHNVTEHTYYSILITVTMASVLILISSRNFVIFILSFLTVSSCLLFSITLLACLDHWTLGVVEGLVISLAAGLAIDPCIHLALAFSSLQTSSNRCRFFSLTNSSQNIYKTLITLGSAITGSTWSTAVAGLPMLGCSLLCYHQVGVFMVTLMFSAWLICYVILAGILACFDCSIPCYPVNDREHP